MTLAPGTRVGPYEIVAPLGAGGMGEVFRARDTRLGREVAIKALPDGFAGDPERLARFEREARLLASLNHPNIATIYGVETEDGRRCLALELIDGESLAQRLARGPLLFEDACEVAAQVASALEAAHEAGVIHRDLKPGNVMVRPDGMAKVLDFGLARGPSAGGSSSDLSQSPTLTSPTMPGVILGTAAYMSPEQAKGRPADRRADVWAWGCLLYECLTAKRAFPGEDVSETIAAILRGEPDWSALPGGTPPGVRELIERCLRKDARERMRDAGDARLLLLEARARTGAPAEKATKSKSLSPLAQVGIAILASLAGVVATKLASREPAPPLMRFSIPAPPGQTPNPGGASFAISPDGATLVFSAADSAGTTRLWLRPIRESAARALAGTEGAVQPFWSPDGRRLGFFAEGKLKRIAVAGGTPELLCDAPTPRGATWGRHGDIVFAPSAAGSLHRVAAGGGQPEEILGPDSTRKETALRFPEFLPDGRHFLFVSLPSHGEMDIHLGVLGSRERRHVLRAESMPAFAEPGYLIFKRQGRLMAQRFNRRTFRLSGEPMSLAPAPPIFGPDGTRSLSVSRTGVLAMPATAESRARLAWVDRSGTIVGEVPLAPSFYDEIRVAPDGRHAVVAKRGGPQEYELWLVDLERGTASRVAAPSPSIGAATWSPDGKRIAYTAQRSGFWDLYSRSLDPPGEEELAFDSDALFTNLYGWSSDGRYLTFEQPASATGWDAWCLPIAKGAKPFPVALTAANEGGGWISPDGRWIAYYSDQSGRNEFYVQSFPTPGARRQVTTTGLVPGPQTPCGFDWARDGRSALMVGGDMVREVEFLGDDLRIGETRVLFRIPPSYAYLCPAPDHRRFLAAVTTDEIVPAAVGLMVNWRSGLEKP